MERKDGKERWSNVSLPVVCSSAVKFLGEKFFLNNLMRVLLGSLLSMLKPFQVGSY